MRTYLLSLAKVVDGEVRWIEEEEEEEERVV